MKEIIRATKIVFSSKTYLAMGILSFLSFLILYLFTLPAIYTGGRVGLISLQFLTLKLTVFSFLLAFLIALILPLNIYSFKNKVKVRVTCTSGGFMGSILPPLLCCSPVIPTFAGIIGVSSPFFLQGFIATYETYIFIGAILLLAYSFILSTKNIEI